MQGLGAAAATPSGIGLVQEVTPDHDRTRTLAVSGIFSSAGVATGPTVGTLIIDNWGWRLSFLIALRVATASYLIGRNALPHSRGNPGEPPLDVVGIASAIVSMSLLTLGVSQGRGWGWVSVSTILATATGLLYGIASGSILFINVFFLRNVWHYGTAKAGVAMLPGPLLASMTAPFAGRLGTRYGERVVAIPGLVLLDALVANFRGSSLVFAVSGGAGAHRFPLSFSAPC